MRIHDFRIFFKIQNLERFGVHIDPKTIVIDYGIIIQKTAFIQLIFFGQTL